MSPLLPVEREGEASSTTASPESICLSFDFRTTAPLQGLRVPERKLRVSRPKTPGEVTCALIDAFQSTSMFSTARSRASFPDLCLRGFIRPVLQPEEIEQIRCCGARGAGFGMLELAISDHLSGMASSADDYVRRLESSTATCYRVRQQLSSMGLLRATGGVKTWAAPTDELLLRLHAYIIEKPSFP